MDILLQQVFSLLFSLAIHNPPLVFFLTRKQKDLLEIQNTQCHLPEDLVKNSNFMFPCKMQRTE